MINLHNGDCIEALAKMQDNQFDLAIVDPPYGYRTNKTNAFNFRKETKEWNVAPNKAYFKELLRISKNQIVWGGNYFPYLWNDIQRGFVVWNKDNPLNNFASTFIVTISPCKNSLSCLAYPIYGTTTST